VLNEIEKRRSVAVAEDWSALTDLGAQEFPNKVALLNELTAARDKANSYRTKADAAVKQSKGSRDARHRQEPVCVVVRAIGNIAEGLGRGPCKYQPE